MNSAEKAYQTALSDRPNIKAALDKSIFPRVGVVEKDGERFLVVWDALSSEANIFTINDELVEVIEDPINLFEITFLIAKGYSLIG